MFPFSHCLHSLWEGQARRENNSIKKWAEDLNRHYSKDTDGQGVHEKMFNITDNYRNSDQKYNKVLPHTREWPSSKNPQSINAVKGVEKKGPLALLVGM